LTKITTFGSIISIRFGRKETMLAQKLSISLPQQQCEFIERYQIEHHFKSRSDVIKEALYLLQQQQLEACYKEANQEIDKAYENASMDGIEDDEAW
jgi:antitoxin ParD1/3/4